MICITISYPMISSNWRFSLLYYSLDLSSYAHSPALALVKLSVNYCNNSKLVSSSPVALHHSYSTHSPSCFIKNLCYFSCLTIFFSFRYSSLPIVTSSPSVIAPSNYCVPDASFLGVPSSLNCVASLSFNKEITLVPDSMSHMFGNSTMISQGLMFSRAICCSEILLSLNFLMSLLIWLVFSHSFCLFTQMRKSHFALEILLNLEIKVKKEGTILSRLSK